jgi:hypothetical protein
VPIGAIDRNWDLSEEVTPKITWHFELSTAEKQRLLTLLGESIEREGEKQGKTVTIAVAEDQEEIEVTERVPGGENETSDRPKASLQTTLSRKHVPRRTYRPTISDCR